MNWSGPFPDAGTTKAEDDWKKLVLIAPKAEDKLVAIGVTADVLAPETIE